MAILKVLPVALQLFTVRDSCKDDFPGTLAKVARMGYAGVEFAGFGDLTPRQMKTCLDNEGLTAVSAHVGIDMLAEKTQYVIDYAGEIGMRYVAIPWLPEHLRPGKPGYAEVKELIARIAPLFGAADIQLLYHNHDFEFVKIDGEYALDVLYRTFGSHALGAEIDTYWVKRAGLVPAEYIRKYPRRVPIVHLKDMEDTPEMFFTEVGSGTQDLPAIFAASEEVGAKWYVVEQDLSRIDALESARVSRENLRKLGL